jgi:hypothetical protein
MESDDYFQQLQYKKYHRLVIDRDVNASRNMMRCLIALLFGLDRPRELQRQQKSTTINSN